MLRRRGSRRSPGTRASPQRAEDTTRRAHLCTGLCSGGWWPRCPHSAARGKHSSGCVPPETWKAVLWWVEVGFRGHGGECHPLPQFPQTEPLGGGPWSTPPRLPVGAPKPSFTGPALLTAERAGWGAMSWLPPAETVPLMCRSRNPNVSAVPQLWPTVNRPGGPCSARHLPQVLGARLEQTFLPTGRTPHGSLRSTGSFPGGKN